MFQASPNLSSTDAEVRAPRCLCKRHGDLAAVAGELLDELLALVHCLHLSGKTEDPAIQSAAVVPQVVPATEGERTGQRAVRDRVARRVERELRTSVELLTVGDDVELAAEHLVVKLERLAGVAGKRYIKRCLHARQSRRKPTRPEAPAPLH